MEKLRCLDRYLRDKELSAIDRKLIDQVTQGKLARGCRNATVNRTLEVLRAVLRKCVNEWEWLDRAPRVRMLKQPKRRVRFLTAEEAKRLLGGYLSRAASRIQLIHGQDQKDCFFF